MREPAIIAGCCIIQNVIIGAIIHVVVAVWATLYCTVYSVYQCIMVRRNISRSAVESPTVQTTTAQTGRRARAFLQCGEMD